MELPRLTAWKLNEASSVLVEQDPIQAGIYGVAEVNGNRTQRVAAGKRPIADADDAFRHGHTSQVKTARERRVPNGRDQVGNAVTPRLATRILNQSILGLIEQNAVHAAVDGVEGIHIYSHQIHTALKRVIDTCNAPGNRYGDQIRALLMPLMRQRSSSVKP